MSAQIRLITMRFDAATMRLMPRFRAAVAKEKNRFIKSYMDNYAKNGTFSDNLLEDHQQKMEKIFLENYKRIVKVAATVAPSTVIGLKSSALSLEFKRNTYDAALAAYFETFGARRAKLAAKTTASDIKRLFEAAFENEQNEAAAISAGLKARGLSAFRADTIARTETHQAASFANRFVADEISQELDMEMEKAWSPVNDDRTRESHAEMSTDDWIAMDDRFDVGGELMDRPGDPTASPENTINCRCVEVHRLVGLPV